MNNVENSLKSKAFKKLTKSLVKNLEKKRVNLDKEIMKSSSSMPKNSIKKKPKKKLT